MMKRKKFIQTLSSVAITIPSLGFLHSCSGIYYATAKEEVDKLTIAKHEFILEKNNKVSKMSVELLTKLIILFLDYCFICISGRR